MFIVSNYADVIKNSSLLVNKLWINNSNKNQILDPISCIIRLGMLNFKEKGSKVSINDNKISFHGNRFFF